MTDALVMPTGICPVKTCKGTRIHRHPAFSSLSQAIARAWGNGVVCEIDQCKTCSAIWEPWPEGTSIDCVERSACNNCAYRSSSAESKDPLKWSELVAIAKRAADGAWFNGDTDPSYFCCHKGIPIVLDTKKNTIAFDFDAAGVDRLGQTCRGFLNVMWAHQDKKNKSPTTHANEETAQ